MPRIITHVVQDVQCWLADKSERAATLPGITNVTDLVAMDGSKHAGVVFDVDGLDALNTLLASTPPEVAAQVEAHG
jgi:hypothetical protein